MTDFLLLTLFAPFTSWGDIAVGESRGSWDRPSRSAVLGLIAASLGIERHDQEALDVLDADYGVAVRVDVPGTALVDYHTTQAVSSSIVRKRKPATRAELLAIPERDTILSQRVYWQDALATVALWKRNPGARWTLQELKSALLRPRFVPYAGRKANAFGLPLNPDIVSGATLAEALQGRAASFSEIPVLDTEAFPEPVNGGQEVSHDPCEGFLSGLRPLRREVRRDRQTQRARWHFGERVVEVGAMPSEVT